MAGISRQLPDGAVSPERSGTIRTMPELWGGEMNYTLAKSPKVNSQIHLVCVTKPPQNPKQMEFRKHPGRHKISMSGVAHATAQRQELHLSGVFQISHSTPLLLLRCILRTFSIMNWQICTNVLLRFVRHHNKLSDLRRN